MKSIIRVINVLIGLLNMEEAFVLSVLLTADEDLSDRNTTDALIKRYEAGEFSDVKFIMNSMSIAYDLADAIDKDKLSEDVQQSAYQRVKDTSAVIRNAKLN